MKRREMLGVGAATLLAGCSSAADENRNEAYAEQTAEAVDDEPSVNLDNWAINDGTLLDRVICDTHPFSLGCECHQTEV